MNYMNDSDLPGGVANRARSFYLDFLFVKQDEFKKSAQSGDGVINISNQNKKTTGPVKQGGPGIK